jgi:hypothetical protein
MISSQEITNLQYHVKVLTAKLRQLKNKQKRFLEKMKRLDLIKNYSKKIPRRSETSIRMCSV